MVGLHGPIGGGKARLFSGAAPQRNAIASCVPPGRVAPPMSISCDQPHPREILGWQVADAGTDAATSFARSCSELARRMMGMSDPTADGALGVSVVVLRNPDDVAREAWGPGHGGPYRAACTIGTSSARLLAGSLTGLGNSPVPWA